jgi:cytoskeletal protein CcmA (bactofilin family)
MWNKRDEELGRPMAPQQPGSAPLPPVQPPPVVSDRYDAAAIGSSIKIVGDVTGDEDLTILGKIEGKIVLPKHSVTIGQSGRVKTATMLGNLTAPRVGLEDGCRFRGSVEMEAPAEKGRPAATQSAPAASPSSGSSGGTGVASSSPVAVSAPKHEPLARP